MANFSTSQTDNQNYLKATSFQFKLQKAPKMTYNCQMGPLPGLSFDNIPVFSGGGNTIPLHLAATNPTYDELNLTFLIDEKLENWLEIHNWMTSTQNAKEFENVEGTIDGMSDGTLILLSSAYNPLVQINFYNMFPKSITGIDFDSTSTDSEPLTSTVTFAYQAYDVTPLP